MAKADIDFEKELWDAANELRGAVSGHTGTIADTLGPLFDSIVSAMDDVK